ncbi:MAG: AmmeMemoRadiSam system radical SAM enzyme [Myxococcales bacterium]|nr:AmmeMemoRadiSam system radical SAM enzyme [Myxococcales bacterium]MCB9647384.1 AmmeMemoRadiSam system radical SAM enzyme [Deltaproteobacteria bacterium]
MRSGEAHPGRHYAALPDGRLRCEICPRLCTLRDGQRGLCFVRQRAGDQIILTTYGRSSGFAIDPIEKKPLNHFYPGTPVLSFGTAGCNLACKFCQNWDISKSRHMDTLQSEASPEAIAEAAVSHGVRSVAFTYNDPVIFLEYAVDTARICRARGLETVAVTAGYITPPARADFFSHMTAANVDLKAFTEDFYWRISKAHLQPVLETLEYLAQETRIWLEITTLIIPGYNDSDAELTRGAEWIAEHLGPHVPLHYSAFHPDYKMMDVPATPPATLRRARRLAMQAGLQFVYTGNVHDREGDTTFCPTCRAPLIVRDWYDLLAYHLVSGRCERCDTPIPGRFSTRPGTWGRRRMAVEI